MSNPSSGCLSIAVVGAGPTAVYFLQELLARTMPCSVTFFEAGQEPGRGMPYATSHNDAGMLALFRGLVRAAENSHLAVR